jgi:hypothetical protein
MPPSSYGRQSQGAGFCHQGRPLPRRLWRRLQLAGGGAGINLLNGKWKNYPGVLVPCCRECNNNYMSEVEKRIAKGIKSFAAFEKLSRSVISEYTGVSLKQPWSDKQDDPINLVVGKDGGFRNIPFEQNVAYPM